MASNVASLLQGQSSLSSSQPSLQLVPGLGRGRVKTRIKTLRLPPPQLCILGGKDVPFRFRISRLLWPPLESTS